VDAIDAAAKAFSEKFGFVPILDNASHLYLPTTTLKTAFGADRGLARLGEVGSMAGDRTVQVLRVRRIRSCALTS
jgi:hypothetical protein